MSIPDVRWYDDLDLFGNDVDDDSESLEQDCYHVIIEDLGTNPQDPNSGLGVESALSDVKDPTIASQAESQLATDDRVAGVQATITDDGEVTETLDVAIQPDPNQVDDSAVVTISVPIVGGNNAT